MPATGRFTLRTSMKIDGWQCDRELGDGQIFDKWLDAQVDRLGRRRSRYDHPRANANWAGRVIGRIPQPHPRACARQELFISAQSVRSAVSAIRVILVAEGHTAATVRSVRGPRLYELGGRA
uniref:Uncharacterized protein n=1 Tax=Plectus sambesii TaxID=2011161 RepID=A0A914WYK6_9BILA